MTRLPCRARLLYPASERREVTCGFNEPVSGSIGKRCARGTANVVVYGENGQEDRIDAESLMGCAGRCYLNWLWGAIMAAQLSHIRYASGDVTVLTLMAVSREAARCELIIVIDGIDHCTLRAYTHEDLRRP